MDDPHEPPEPAEDRIIAAILAGARPAGARVGPGDDAAVLADGTAISTDVLVEGVHFDGRLDAADVGFKAVAVNASDLGAMGCRPAWAVLGLSVPAPVDEAWVAAFARGLHEGLATWGIALVGGDTTGSPGPRVVGLTVGGRTARPVTRGGARPGDRLWVTGVLGEAAHGFFAGGEGLAWLRRPRPPVGLGVALAEAGIPTAMMDLSDGLARDLPRLCRASGVGAIVEPDRLPAGPGAAGRADPLPWLVAFGEDYQLLFAAPPDRDADITALAAEHGVEVTAIGAILAGSEVRLRGRAWPAPLFDHHGRAG